MDDNENIASLGFVGLGVMGAHMCTNLARKSGCKVLGYDNNPSPLNLGGEVKIVSDLASLCDEAETVFLCLPNSAAVDDVCSQILRTQGRVRCVVDCSTSSIVATLALAKRLTEAGIAFADAPIARMREAAKEGTLLFMVGAEPMLFEDLTPLLSCMGSDFVHCGPVGSGQAVKILNNMVLISNVHALATALCAAEAQGIAGDTLFRALSLGSADSLALRRQGFGHLLKEDFPQNTFSTRYARKDIAMAQELLALGGITSEQVDSTARLLEKATNAGLGDFYYPAFVNVVARGRDQKEEDLQ